MTNSERSSAPMTLLTFRVKGGGTARFNTYICSQVRDGQKFYLFQSFRLVDAAAQASAVDGGKPQGFSHDTGTAQRQKLDCALQLARTVALDFNNALTSILGHTSLLLGKMELTHPWRSSLVEVEKSASRAAEIANDLGSFSRQEKDARVQTAGNINT